MKVFMGCAEESGEKLLKTYLIEIFKLIPDAQVYTQSSLKIKEMFPQVTVLFDRELCNVMGLVDPLKRLPALLKRRSNINNWIEKYSPDLVIGFDAPDFFLAIEAVAKRNNIYSLHVVSPSIWAWRPGRIKTILSSVHELHCLFSFEKKYYEGHDLSLEVIGHPFFKETKNNIERDHGHLLLVPGSRVNEIKNHLPIFLKLARELKKNNLISKYSIAAAPGRDQLLLDLGAKSEDFIDYKKGLSIAGFAIVCSGTATLEAFIACCPQFVVYHIPLWKKLLIKFLVKTPWIGLPNILMQSKIIDEFVGDVNKMYNRILERCQVVLSQKAYFDYSEKQIAAAHHLIKENQKICLFTIMKNLLSRVSMKPVEVA